MYVFFCQMPKTKACSGAFQKGAYVRSNRRQGHVALHHFETAHYCEYIGHYKKRHTHAPQKVWRFYHSAFHESISKSGQNRSQKTFYEFVKLYCENN